MDKRGKSLRTSSLITQIMGELVSIMLGVAIMYFDNFNEHGIVMGVIWCFVVSILTTAVSLILYNCGVILDRISYIESSVCGGGNYAAGSQFNGTQTGNVYPGGYNVSTYNANGYNQNVNAYGTSANYSYNHQANTFNDERYSEKNETKSFHCPKCGQPVLKGQPLCVCGTKFDWTKNN